MTREEQLDWLCRLRSEIYVYMPKEWLIPMNDALDMAIKALEQESIIKESKEYITKQALEDTLMTAYKHQLSDHDAKLFVEFMSFVDDLPSVTLQELIHGKCNQCRYYEGVHNVKGHAPCSYHKIGGVLWNWYCSQFESEVKE